jgi:hypothetical protein
VNVEEAVVERMMADGGVSALVGTRVFLLKLPQRVSFPAIRVQLISNPRGKHLRGPDGTTRARVQVDCYDAETSADPYSAVSATAEAAVNARVFEPFNGGGSPASIRITGCSVNDMRSMREQEPQEDPKVRRMIDLYVWSTQL